MERRERSGSSELIMPDLPTSKQKENLERRRSASKERAKSRDSSNSKPEFNELQDMAPSTPRGGEIKMLIPI